MQGFEQLDPIAFAAWLSQLPEDHPMLVAARAAVEVGDLRRERRRALREASHEVCKAVRGVTIGPSFDELQRRRGEVWCPAAGRWTAA